MDGQNQVFNTEIFAMGGAAISIELVALLVTKGILNKAEGDAIFQAAKARYQDPAHQAEFSRLVKSALLNANV